MSNIVTVDLSEFGYRELKTAIELLTAYSKGEAGFKDRDDFFDEGLTLNSNSSSGYVFLCDEDYNVGMLNDNGEIEQFINCGYCGKEGLKSELKPFCEEGYCRDCHLKECVKDEVKEIVKEANLKENDK